MSEQVPSKEWTKEPPIVETLRTHFATVLGSYRMEKAEWRQLIGYICGLKDDLEQVRSVGTRIAVEKFNLKGELRDAQSSHEPPAVPARTLIEHLHGYVTGTSDQMGYAKALQAIELALGASQPPPADDLKEATRLLHIVNAWFWRASDDPDSARVDPLYPARGSSSSKAPLFAAIRALLDRHPYGGVTSTKGAGQP